MLNVGSLATVCLLLSHLACADSKVEALYDSNFDEVAGKSVLFVKFQAPWCGYCNKFEPTWETVDKTVRKSSMSLKVANVDCTDPGAKKICKRYNVLGYPDLRLVYTNAGDVMAVKYDGARDFKAVMAFTEKAANNPSELGGETVKSLERAGYDEVQADEGDSSAATPETTQQQSSGQVVKMTKAEMLATAQEGPVFVKFFVPWCGHCKKLAPAWTQLAKKAGTEGSSVVVAEADCTGKGKSACSHYKVTGFPKMKLLFPDGDDVGVASYSGARTLNEMWKWMTKVEQNPEAHRDKGSKKPKNGGGEAPAPEARAVEEEAAGAEPAEEPASPPPAAAKNDGGGSTPHGGVAKVSDGSKLAEMVKAGPVFVKFFAPWCGHCKKLAPAWEDLAKKAAAKGSVAKVVEVDCTADGGRKLCVNFKVTAYPKLKMLFQDGEEVGQASYTGDRSVEKMFQFMTKAEATPKAFKDAPGADKPKPSAAQASQVASVPTASRLKEMLKSGPAFVKFFAPWCGHCKKLAPVWEKVAEKAKAEDLGTRVAELDCTTGAGKAMCSIFGVKGFPKMMMLFEEERGDVGVVSYDGGRSFDELFNFVRTLRNPRPLMEKSVKLPISSPPSPPPPSDAAAGSKVFAIPSASSLQDRLKAGPLFLKFFAPWCGHCKKLAPTWVDLADKAEQQGSNVTVAEVDCTTEAGKPLCGQFGVQGFPKMKYLFADGDAVGVASFSGSRTLEAMYAFMAQAEADPQAAKEDTVRLEVVKAFDQANSKVVGIEGGLLLEAQDSPVFVKFYSPSCGHCKKLAPTWSELADAVEEKQLGVKVAKVDCTAEGSADDCKLFGVKAFPTLKLLFPNGDNVGVLKYNRKERSLKALQTFLAEALADPHAQEGREGDVLPSGERSKEVRVNGKDGKTKFTYTIEPLEDDETDKAKSEL